MRLRLRWPWEVRRDKEHFETGQRLAREAWGSLYGVPIVMEDAYHLDADGLHRVAPREAQQPTEGVADDPR